MNWQHTYALVTGATRGIGYRLVVDLLSRGARVTATGTDPRTLEAARAQLPGVNWQLLDQADEGSRAALAQALQGQGVNLVIHNAGVQQPRSFTDATQEVAFGTEQEMKVNFVGPVELTRLLLPGLMAQPAAGIVFITSGLALAPKQGSPVYCASKAALHSFAKSLRAQLRLAGSGVRVAEALPPMVDTDMTRGRGKGKISAEAAARQVLDGVAAGREEIDVGATRILRAILRVSPGLGERIMINR